jgi:predicted MPP superfamily phosphohydrolase
MYLLTELLLFSPLIVYACIRIWKLIARPALKNTFVVLYILLFLGYPVAEALSHKEISGWIRHLVILGYYCLPYLLYFTLLIVVVDIVIALARIVNLFRPELISSIRFRAIRLSICLVIPALIVFAGALNNNRLQVKEYSIELLQKSSSIKELKMVYASDFHLSPITNDLLLNRFVDKVNALHPDIVLLGGDILEGHGNKNLGRFENQFRRLRAKYGVYAAPGNHESHSESPNDFFVNSGIKLLEDKLENIDQAFYLAGRKNGRSSIKKPIEDLLKATPDDLPIILLDHSPTDLERVSRSRVDLQLSGHTHNGQLFPVNLFVMPYEYELAWGTKVKHDTRFIVSSGIQAWGPPVKTAGDSEILLIKASFRLDAHLPSLGSQLRLATIQGN